MAREQLWIRTDPRLWPMYPNTEFSSEDHVNDNMFYFRMIFYNALNVVNDTWCKCTAGKIIFTFVSKVALHSPFATFISRAFFTCSILSCYMCLKYIIRQVSSLMGATGITMVLSLVLFEYLKKKTTYILQLITICTILKLYS